MLLSITDADLRIAHAVFFDSSHMRWAGADNWWINEVIHTGGRWFMRWVMVATLCLCAATYISESLSHLRRSAGYFLVSTVLTVAVVGLLKHVTNVDCPWDLVPFGGQFPYVHLFADRPDNLRVASCFPAAHSSSGYALMGLYFLWLERDQRRARAGLALGIAIGLIFGTAQQARGAHFLSHDLWSAMLAWCIPLSVYCFGFRCCLWPAPRAESLPVEGFAGVPLLPG
jgi:membrane-associated PAP2 superfamily phosphatase